MYTETEFKKPKLGPVVPASHSRVVFRIRGESVLRYYDGNHHWNMFGRDAFGTPASWCQTFIDMKCRAFVRLDGYDPITRTAVGTEVLESEVDMFYTDHPLVAVAAKDAILSGLHKVVKEAIADGAKA